MRRFDTWDSGIIFYPGEDFHRKRGASMTRNDKQSAQPIGIRLSLWSIRNQTWLAGQIRIYIYAGTVLIAFLSLAGVITIETAMLSAFCGGVIIMGLIWTLVQQRKAILLNINEPEMRRKAHNTMLAYLKEIDPDTFAYRDLRPIAAKHRDECPECHL